MFYFEILPDDILFIILLKSFKNRKSLSQISDRLYFNHNKLISLIKSGFVEPELWTPKLKNIDTDFLSIPYYKYYIIINNININNINYNYNYKNYRDIINILFMDKNILQIYHNDHVYGVDGYLGIIYKLKSSKELLDFLNNNNISISKLKSNILYVNVSQNCDKVGDIITNININNNWSNFWNMNLDNITKDDMLELNDII